MMFDLVRREHNVSTGQSRIDNDVRVGGNSSFTCDTRQSSAVPESLFNGVVVFA